MARSFYPGDIIVQAGAGTPPAVNLAPGGYFTVWSAKSGGSQYTDLKASDGVTTLPTSGSPAKPFADGNGIRPDLYGPDAVSGVLWCDLGATGRFAMYPSTEVDTILAQGAKKNVANTFTAQQSFTGTATAFTNTPTVSGNLLTHAGNLGTQLSDVPTLVAYLNATGQPYTIYINPTTGAWPNSGTRVHATGTAMTGFTGRWIWDSQSYQGALQPAGRVDGDFWDERV